MTHIPVMCAEAIEQVRVSPGQVYLDCTFGDGGYTRALLERGARVYALDRDPEAWTRGQELAQKETHLTLLQGCFSAMTSLLSEHVHTVHGVLFDLGMSSRHVDQAHRGFSFQKDGPLDMRMTPEGPTAADVVSSLSESSLRDLIHTLGEEPYARRIARRIVTTRHRHPFTTTRELAELVREVVPRIGHRDPATKTFQALRMYVNAELEELEKGLHASLSLLIPKGRLVVVSFHSLEDRMVKTFFKAHSTPLSSNRYRPLLPTPESSLTVVTPHPLRPSAKECSRNPRARSARLRVAERKEKRDL